MIKDKRGGEKSISELLDIFKETKRRELTIVNVVNECVRESNFDTLTLGEYETALAFECNSFHTKCTKCLPLRKVCKILSEEKFCALPMLWRRCFPGKYDCEKAQRKLLQMPLAAIRIANEGVFIVERRDEQFYSTMMATIQNLTRRKEDEPRNIDLVNDILFLADNEAEKERIKYAISSTQNISRREAHKRYGISGMKHRGEKISNALDTKRNIQRINEAFMRIEMRAFLEREAVDREGYLTASSDESSEYEDDFDTNDQEDEASIMKPPEKYTTDETHSLSINNQKQIYKEKTIPPWESIISLSDGYKLLEECNFNWGSFVEHINCLFCEKSVIDEEIVEGFLSMVLQEQHQHLSESAMKILEASKETFFEVQRQRVMLNDAREDEMSDISESDDESQSNVDVTKAVKRIKDKWRKRFKICVAKKRIMNRKISKSTKGILKQFPDIGKVMERIVKDADIGADRWRRTGAYTITGNIKNSKRITFRKIREELMQHYKRNFSIGTVAELCAKRNKRRRASLRYKGVANIRFRKAWKGFSIKLNPDTHWSRSLYRNLDKLQKDNTNMSIFGRDDQAGFRLDTTYTHKQYGSHLDENTVTTRTDFVNKRATVLQISSYNFPETNNSVEVCVGVVKASLVHTKSPTQHMCDLEMLETKEELRSLFQRSDGNGCKEVECVRVDGATDEGPGHSEVQFLWTERHIQRETKATIVTTRCSGDSFLNRTELQNGCTSRGHSNLFIPSTMNGPSVDDKGEFSEQKFKENMRTAVKQYIERVNGTPCMKTELKLYPGVEDHEKKQRRSDLLIYLRGTKKAKQSLKDRHPILFKYFEDVWTVRNAHMDKSLPEKYILFLQCCGRPTCYHPRCKGKLLSRRYPGSRISTKK